MLIALALVAQGPTLDADQAKAAATCAAASSAASDATMPKGERYLIGVAEMTYFAMTAARPGPGGWAFVQRVSAKVDEINANPVTPLAQAKALLPKCDARFPLARRSTPAKLPLMELDRTLMCAAAGIFLQGASTAAQDDANPDFQWLTPYRARFQGMIDKQRAPGGQLADQGTFQERFGGQLAASLDYGNLFSVAQACRKLP